MSSKKSDIRWVMSGQNEEIFVEENEHVHVVLMAVNEIQKETSLVVHLKGLHASVQTHVLFLGGANEELSIHVRHVHEAPQTHSELHARGAVCGQASARFFGTIDMPAHCDQASGNLNEHMLILSPTARIETVPALEIAHHAVSASHSASIERVNADQLFYLMSRGIHESLAFRLVIEGFFAEIVRTLPHADSIFESFASKLNDNLVSFSSPS